MVPQPPDSELPTLAADPTVAATEPVQLGAGGRLDETGVAVRYERGELLGRGGMGEVFSCRDSRIGRRVAFKQLRTGPGTSRGSGERARFMREARIQAQLEHPAVVPVYELGRTPDGGEFFTMKRVRGRTLADVLVELKNGAPEAAARYSTRKLLTAFSSVCLAVQYAHERGVLHRDLKPANLMLGDFGEVYVLDWGVAKLFGETDGGEAIEDAADEGVHTVAGSIFGTPGYSAPEQLSGRPTDPKSDVYALGAILFEILALEPLVPRAVMSRMVADTLAGADARVWVRYPDRQDAAPELEALCVRATATDPADRLASAADLHLAVERYLDGDRDVQLRRQLAAGHAALAEIAAERAFATGDIADRERALVEVGRAIALDPDHATGAATLVRLLTEPPRRVPDEVTGSIRRAQDDEIRYAGRLSGLIYLFCLVLVAPLLIAGVLSWAALALTVGLVIVTAVYMFVGSRLESPSTLVMTIGVWLGFACIASTCSVFGVYTILPAFIATSAVSTVQFGRRLPSWVPLSGACLSVLVPVVLEWLGLLAPSHNFEGGTIEILPRMIAFPGRGTEPLLLFLTLAAIVLPAFYAIRQHRVLDEANRRLHMYAWQLQRLLPPAR
ncbi:MAG TPA: serine/threonine-protein kinase [Kofleriaceae bacterium]|jgi:serine/threonine-protein kinase